MKIIIQNEYNECGICVANMMINHYYKKFVDRKNELYSLCENLTKDGLNIYDIEILLSKYNIEIESYNSEWSELFSIKTPFILVLKNNFANHYVFCKIKNNLLYMYDPVGEEYVYSKEEINNQYIGIVLISKYNNIKIKPININLNIMKNISWLFNIFMILINIFEFLFILFTSVLLSKIINLNIDLTFTDTLWKLSFVYIVILLISEGFNILNDLIKMKYFFNVYHKSINVFWKNINLKLFNFFQIYNEHKLNQIYGYVNKIIQFYSFFASNFISELIIFLISGICLIIINHITLYFLIIIFLLNLLLMYFNFSNQKESIKLGINNEDKLNNNLIKYFHYKKNNINLKLDIINGQKIQNNIQNIIYKQTKINYKDNIITFLNKFINSLVQYILLILCIQTHKNNLGIIFLISNLLTLFTSSLKTLLNYNKEYFSHIVIIKYLTNIFQTNNLKSTSDINIFEIKNIVFNKQIYNKNICINIVNIFNSDLVQKIINCYDPLNLIKINSFNLSNINIKNFYENNLIVCDLNNLYVNNNIEFNQKYINEDEYSYIINKYYNDNYDFTYYKINYLIQLCESKNKLIIINDTFNDIDDEQTLNIIYKLLTIINNNNYLISNCKNNKLVNIYENFI